MGELSNTTINGVSYDFKDAGAARQSHSHTKSDITDFPTSMPASDVPAWAKESSKPTYTASEVGAIATSAKGTANGVASLDSTGKVPSSQLPSYVDDVLEYSAKSSFPATGETGKIYVDTSNNKTYRWSGSAYVEISESLALGETSSTAYRGDRGKTAYDHSQTTSGNPHNVTKSDVGLGNVGNFKAVSTAASQGLSDTEKSNARSNIGAGTGNGTYSKPSDGIPKTDLASAVQTSLGKADSALQSHQTITQDGITGATVNRFGTCSTAAATAAKTVSVTSGTFSLEAGARVTVKFTNANTAGTPTLNVNSKGAKNIFHKGAQITTGSNKSLLAGAVDFIYDGTQWHLIGNYIDTNDNTYPSAYCSTAAGTAAKVATCTGYALLAKSYIHVIITTANTSASALTLNINSKGAKPIYINGSASSASNYTLPAGSYLVYYDGTNYYFRTDGMITTGDHVTAFNDGSPWSVADLLITYKVMLSDGSAGTVAASQSYACKSNHIVSLHVCITTKREIAVGSETAIGYVYSSPYGDNYHFYPLTLAFYSGTPIAGVQCYMRGGERYIYVKSLQAAIPSNTRLYINGTYLTESSFPDLPT